MHARDLSRELTQPVPRTLLEDRNFQSLLSCLNIGLFLSDSLFNRLISFSSNVADILEIDPVQLKNYPKRWGEILRSEEGGLLDEILLTALDRGEKVDFDLNIQNRSDGKKKRIRVTLLDCGVRQAHEIFGQIQDITSIREREIALARIQSVEVEISARIQKKLLLGVPGNLPDGLEIAATSIPSQHVDGDFYEFNRLSPDTEDFFIGDVMGKGLNASLLGAGAKNLFQKNLIRLIAGGESLPTLERIVDLADSYLSKDLIQYNSFITLNYTRLDIQKGLFHSVDCGHNPVIHYSSRDNYCWLLDGYNMPLGFKDHQIFREICLPVSGGDYLLYHSDGISEAKNSQGEFFGMDRLIHMLRGFRDLSPSELTEKIIRLSFSYSHGGFEDDATVIAVKIGQVKREDTEVKQYSLSLHDFYEKEKWKEALSALQQDFSSLWGKDREKELFSQVNSWLQWLSEQMGDFDRAEIEASYPEELDSSEEEESLDPQEKLEWFILNDKIYFQMIYQGPMCKPKGENFPLIEWKLYNGLKNFRKITVLFDMKETEGTAHV